MMHVHWWLAMLSFLLGMVLTVALMVRPVAQRVPASGVKPVAKRPPHKPAPARKKPAPAKAVAAPRKKAVAKEPPTTKLPAKKVPPGKRLPAKKVPGKKVPAGKDAATKRLPVRDAPTSRIPGTRDRPRQKTRMRREPRTTKMPTTPFAPYGPGSARAEADGSGPPGWLVKGRSDTRLYYTPDDSTYERVIAQVWFTDEDSAARAFFTPWSKSARRKRGSISGQG
ncbi:hypothetical protein [Mycobacterium kubicae]|uniref:channel accessory protein ArfC, sunset domain variant n=1 Tax=Mycobacterium kubicae TaxID=120959 RepID=UPI00163EEF38